MPRVSGRCPPPPPVSVEVFVERELIVSELQDEQKLHLYWAMLVYYLPSKYEPTKQSTSGIAPHANVLLARHAILKLLSFLTTGNEWRQAFQNDRDRSDKMVGIGGSCSVVLARENGFPSNAGDGGLVMEHSPAVITENKKSNSVLFDKVFLGNDICTHTFLSSKTSLASGRFLMDCLSGLTVSVNNKEKVREESREKFDEQITRPFKNLQDSQRERLKNLPVQQEHHKNAIARQWNVLKRTLMSERSPWGSKYVGLLLMRFKTVLC